jgi:hypothetical protein
MKFIPIVSLDTSYWHTMGHKITVTFSPKRETHFNSYAPFFPTPVILICPITRQGASRNSITIRFSELIYASKPDRTLVIRIFNITLTTVIFTKHDYANLRISMSGL